MAFEAILPPSPSEVKLIALLHQAAQVEHLLALEYLFAALSLKKYPEEFDKCDLTNPEVRSKVEAQVERNRRWAAQVLFVSRQEI